MKVYKQQLVRSLAKEDSDDRDNFEGKVVHALVESRRLSDLDPIRLRIIPHDVLGSVRQVPNEQSASSDETSLHGVRGGRMHIGRRRHELLHARRHGCARPQ